MVELVTVRSDGDVCETVTLLSPVAGYSVVVVLQHSALGTPVVKLTLTDGTSLFSILERTHSI